MNKMKYNFTKSRQLPQFQLDSWGSLPKYLKIIFSFGLRQRGEW